ncbi:MAG: von Willebrand factor type A domain-containing protein [Acidobacteriota bacterium]|nr:von Willebrand factor type A domain-containing protein [Acidobacteriota bacterium]
MTDPLDDLKRAFADATPEPDADRRKANLARAQELFDRVQDSGAEQRRTDGRTNPWAAIEQGVRRMLSALTSRPVLAAAGVLAAVGLTALFVTATRNATPPSSMIVADAGVAPEPIAAPASDADSERSTPAPTDRQAAVDGDLAVIPTAPVREPAEPQPPVRETALPVDSEASETVVDELDRQPEAPPPAQERSSPVTVATADAESFNATIAALERQREALRTQLEALAEVVAPPPPPPAPEPVLPPGARLAESSTGRVGRLSRSIEALSFVAETPLPASAVDATVAPRSNTEAFANEDASPVKVASEEPVSTFSIDVDTASYSVVRSSLTNGYLPVPESVRIEELINYFPYGYPAPGERGAPFRPTVSVSETPWNPDTLLMHIGIQGRRPATDDRPPLNLVFLVDTSGSMDQPNKLPLLVQSFRLMVGQLDPADEVAIVAYAGSAGRVLDPTPAGERGAILTALDRLHAGGSTAGAAGIQLAYRVARDMAAEGEVTRVILATDGDFNVGISDPDELEGFIARQRERGVYLSVLGFGRGNLDDATMQALAQNGNGQAAYIDTLAEAQKVLVDQLVGTLFPIANDVKIQVEFNPATVAEYRLIGYETRGLRREDFNNDRVDAGEIGAGHSVTAIYEVTPVGSPAVLHDALRYAGRPADPPVADGRRGGSRELAFLRLRYKEPGEESSELIELPITRDAGGVDAEQRFAAAIAGFGQLLRDGAYTGDWTWSDAVALAEANTGDDRYGYRREAVTLMRLAESLAQ